MRTALIISSADSASAALKQLLQERQWGECQTVRTGEEARRMAGEQEWELVLINTPLSDEFGEELALNFAGRGSGVLMIVRGELAGQVSGRVGKEGVFVLSRPVHRGFFHQAVELLEAARNQLAHYRAENIQLRDKIEELRLIDRAKCVLIAYLNMTEPQAHRYIEKQAMDLRSTKREVALNILKTYET